MLSKLLLLTEVFVVTLNSIYVSFLLSLSSHMAVRLQDPIHYPHGTKFMAPGPMGQCYPLPDNDEVKQVMLRTADNHRKIFNMWNFDYHTKVSRLGHIAALSSTSSSPFVDGSTVTTVLSSATTCAIHFLGVHPSNSVVCMQGLQLEMCIA